MTGDISTIEILFGVKPLFALEQLRFCAEEDSYTNADSLN